MDKHLADMLYNHSREEWSDIINNYVFDEQARYICSRVLLDLRPYELIAEELNITRGTVYNKFKKWEKQVFKTARKKGF